MTDKLSELKRPLAGWLWSNTRHMNFDTVFCPFSGWPTIAMMFKEQGKGVVTTDLLASHYQLARAQVENPREVLDPFDVDKLLEDNPGKVQLMEGLCNAYGMAPEHGAWLDTLHSNIEKLDGDIKQSMALCVGIRVIRYLMSFDDDTRYVMPDEDPSGAFHYYVEFMNQKVFSNGIPSEAHNLDAADLAATVGTDALCFYLPSGAGYQQLTPERRMMELFVHSCTESELDELLQDKPTGLGAPAESDGQYKEQIDDFLKAAADIPIWILGYNEAGRIPVRDIQGILQGYRKNVMLLENTVLQAFEDKYSEYLLIAHP